jgi:hypothetical protein
MKFGNAILPLTFVSCTRNVTTLHRQLITQRKDITSKEKDTTL